MSSKSWRKIIKSKWVLTLVGLTLIFDERIAGGTSTCAAGGIASFRLQQNGTVLFHFDPGSSGGPGYDGILRRKLAHTWSIIARKGIIFPII
jgi:hypothetical protein